MTDSNANLSPETASRDNKMPTHSDDLPAIIRQIRHCRCTLGAVLEELECGDGHAHAIELLSECATGVTAEIESLWDAAKPVE